jgi:predicted DCC family thiol-disulfide oxidoreductase YuxK
MYNKEHWPLTLYFDGNCPLCAREITILRRHAAESRLLFVDIDSPEFDAKALGFTFEQMQATLHACFADGRWVNGLDVTLCSWRAAGLGFWATPLTWRALRPLLALGYRLFCRLRPIWRGYLTRMAAVDVSITVARCRKRNPHATSCSPSKQSSPRTLRFGIGLT